MASRPHPAPLFASVHVESVSRVPQATSFAISALIDFSSTLARMTFPLGRANIFGCGFPLAGSAGSRGAACCAPAGIAPRTKTKTASAASAPKRKPRRFPKFLMFLSPRAIWTFFERVILTHLHFHSPVLPIRSPVLTFFVHEQAHRRALKRPRLELRSSRG